MFQFQFQLLFHLDILYPKRCNLKFEMNSLMLKETYNNEFQCVLKDTICIHIINTLHLSVSNNCLRIVFRQISSIED